MKTPKYNKISTQGFSDRNGFGVTIKYEKEETKEVYEYDYPNEYTAEIRFYDLCKAGQNAFSVSGHNSKDANATVGDLLVEIDPSLEIFNDLHLCYADGLSVGFVVNAFHCIKSGFSKTLKKYGLNEKEIEIVENAQTGEEFAFLIQGKTNFLERRKKLAKQGLEKLKQLAGEYAKTKIKPDTAKSVFVPLTKEELSEWEKKFKNGYFKKESIDKRKKEEEEAWLREEEQKIKNTALVKQKELEDEKNVKLEILKFSKTMYENVNICPSSKIITLNTWGNRGQVRKHKILEFIAQSRRWIDKWDIYNQARLIKPRDNV